MTDSHRLMLYVFLFVALEAALINFVDRPLAEYMRTIDMQHQEVINFFRAYTDLGKSKWYLWPAGIGVFICIALTRLKVRSALRTQAARIGEAILFVFVCVGGSGIITDIIKPILGRGRPVELEREGLYSFHPFSFHAPWNSMPSGHATTAFALASLLIMFFPRGRVGWIALACLLAISRVIVNAHFLSDVFAGATIGCLTVFIAGRFINHTGIYHVKRCIFPIDSQNRTV